MPYCGFVNFMRSLPNLDLDVEKEGEGMVRLCTLWDVARFPTSIWLSFEVCEVPGELGH